MSLEEFFFLTHLIQGRRSRDVPRWVWDVSREGNSSSPGALSPSLKVLPCVGVELLMNFSLWPLLLILSLGITGENLAPSSDTFEKFIYLLLSRPSCHSLSSSGRCSKPSIKPHPERYSTFSGAFPSCLPHGAPLPGRAAGPEGERAGAESSGGRWRTGGQGDESCGE